MSNRTKYHGYTMEHVVVDLYAATITSGTTPVLDASSQTQGMPGWSGALGGLYGASLSAYPVPKQFTSGAYGYNVGDIVMSGTSMDASGVFECQAANSGAAMSNTSFWKQIVYPPQGQNNVNAFPTDQTWLSGVGYPVGSIVMYDGLNYHANAISTGVVPALTASFASWGPVSIVETYPINKGVRSVTRVATGSYQFQFGHSGSWMGNQADTYTRVLGCDFVSNTSQISGSGFGQLPVAQKSCIIADNVAVNGQLTVGLISGSVLADPANGELLLWHFCMKDSTS